MRTATNTMKRTLTCAGILGVVVLVWPAGQLSGQQPADDTKFVVVDQISGVDEPEMFVEDEFIVVLTLGARRGVQVGHDDNGRPTVSIRALQNVIDAHGVNRFRRQFATATPQPVNSRYPDLTGYYKARIPAGVALDVAMAAFSRSPHVDHVEKIGIHFVYVDPNDPFYMDSPAPTFDFDQWHYFDRDTVEFPGENFSIQADQAWVVESGDPSVVIAIADTGVRYFHTDLGGDNSQWGPGNPQTNGNIWVNAMEAGGASGIDEDNNGFVDDTIGYDFVESTGGGCQCLDVDCGTADNDPDDFNGHGTHVAGTVGAITNNFRMVAGIGGGFSDGTTSGVGNGIKILPLRIGWHARCQGVTGGVVRMDYAAEAMNYVCDLVDDGVNVVAFNASWGSSFTGGFDAAVNNLLAHDVMLIHAAGNSNADSPGYLGNKAGVMNVAATDRNGNGASFTNFGSWVDLAAPGVGVVSTYRSPSDPDPNNHYIARLSGTSMSAPHACGVAALLESCKPGLSGPDKFSLMVNNVRSYSDVRDLGSGILNAKLALGAAGCLPQLEVGSAFVGGSPITVNLANTYFSPVVVCSVQYNNNVIPVVPRVRNVTPTSFEIKLQNPSGDSVFVENISYLVVEEGVWTIDGIKVEAQTYVSSVTDGRDNWVGETQSYGQSYSNPVVLGQVMTENDPDWSVFWCRGATLLDPPSSTALVTGKTVCEDISMTRDPETIGFIVIEAGHGVLAGIEFEASVGPDTVEGATQAAPYTYPFNTVFPIAPRVAITTAAGVDGNNGGWAQAHGPTVATESTLFLSIDEDQIGDVERAHTTEQVGYVVFAPPCASGDCDDGLFCNGVETCVDGACQSGSDPCLASELCSQENDVCVSPQLEAGSVIVGGTHTTVDLTNTYINPVVVCSVQYNNNTIPVVARVSNVTSTSFDVRLQNPSNRQVVEENMSYLVVEEGVGTIDGVTIEAHRFISIVTDRRGDWIGEPQRYGQNYTAPVVVGQVMTENDLDWSVFWCRGANRMDPPSSTRLFAGKSVCEDTDVTRVAETIGFVVMEAGHGTLGGVNYEALVGVDSVAGATQFAPYVYTFDTAFSSAPEVAITTIAGANGGDGAWAQGHGGTLATITNLFLSVDEDQVRGVEREHVTEQVGYVVFESPVVYP